MNIYEKLNEAAYSNDLLEFGDKLIDFSTNALLEKNRSNLVKLFYQRLFEYNLIDYAFEGIGNTEKRNYLIYIGNKSVGKYLSYGVPAQTSPVKTLNNLIAFGEEIKSTFSKPIGLGLTEEKLKEIMQYLDYKYNFSSKVFSSKKSIFAIMDYSHKLYNSECLIIKGEHEIIQHFFLYRMNEHNSEITPEAVLFHELSHALHAKCFGDMSDIPSEIIRYLKELCIPKIDSLTSSQQSEVFADILSIGIMYDSQYNMCDPYTMIHNNDKSEFKKLFEKMLSEI